jgi:hypothetical protein
MLAAYLRALPAVMIEIYTDFHSYFYKFCYNLAMKICCVCKYSLSFAMFGNNRSEEDGLSLVCRECKRKLNKKYQQDNKDKIIAKKHEYYLRNKDQIIEKTSNYSKNNKTKCNAYSKATRVRLKTEVFSHYCGGDIKCNGCDERELELLTIDHINGGGNKHRKLTGMKTGKHCYGWLKRNHYPNGFQVLCWNCQFKKKKLEISPNNPTKRQIQKANYAQLVKTQCFANYGEVCSFCATSDIDVLTLDHINDDGAKHRAKTNTRGGMNFYIYLRKNDFPNEPPLQVLCMKCQYRKTQ